MRLAIALALLAACAAEAPQECAPAGDHELVFEEVEGDCGPMLAEVVTLDADGPDDAHGSWCGVDLSAHPDDMCGVGASVECDDVTLVFALSYDERGALEGWAEVARVDASGALACESWYSVTASPLDP